MLEIGMLKVTWLEILMCCGLDSTMTVWGIALSGLKGIEALKLYIWSLESNRLV